MMPFHKISKANHRGLSNGETHDYRDRQPSPTDCICRKYNGDKKGAEQRDQLQCADNIISCPSEPNPAKATAQCNRNVRDEQQSRGRSKLQLHPRQFTTSAKKMPANRDAENGDGLCQQRTFNPEPARDDCSGQAFTCGDQLDDGNENARCPSVRSDTAPRYRSVKAGTKQRASAIVVGAGIIAKKTPGQRINQGDRLKEAVSRAMANMVTEKRK